MIKEKVIVLVLSVLLAAELHEVRGQSGEGAGSSVESSRVSGADGEPEFDQSLGRGWDIDPFGSTPHEVVAEMIKLAEAGKEDVLYDLGSGDGRIPIAAAEQAGARGVGIELRPELIERSRAAAEEAGVGDRVRFIMEDMFTVDISEATVVTLYLFPRTTLKLRPKLLEELRPGARIVAFDYGIEAWPRDKEQAVEHYQGGTLYFWIVPANVSGCWDATVSLDSGGDYGFTLHLDQTFQQVSGRAVISGAEALLEDVKLRGDSLTFSLRIPGLAGEEPLSFEAKVDGGQMKGEAGPAADRLEAGRERPSKMAWRASRDPATMGTIDLPPPPAKAANEAAEDSKGPQAQEENGG